MKKSFQQKLCKDGRLTNVRTYDNISAAKIIQRLKNGIINSQTKISDAFEIYDGINEKPNHFAINAMLHLFKETKQWNKIEECWDDINKLIRKKDSALCYVLIFECLIDSNNAYKVIQTLHYMQYNDMNRTLKLSDSLIIRLIKQCNGNQLLFFYNSVYQKLIKCESKYIDSALMKAFVDNKCNEAALSLFDDKIDASMNDAHFQNILFNLALKICANTKNHQKGKEIHSMINDKNGINLYLKHSLITFYGRCKDIKCAQHIFDSICSKDRDVVTLNVMMSVFLNNCRNDDALCLYQSAKDIKNDRTYVLAIKCCLNLNEYAMGKMIHEQIMASNMKRSIYLNTMLIEFYAHFNDLLSAQKVFVFMNNVKMDQITLRAMFLLYAQNEKYEQTLSLYERYQNVINDDFIYLAVLKACENMKKYKKMKEIILHRINLNDEQTNIQLKNKVIDIYGLLKQIEDAKNVFYQIRQNQKTKSSINCIVKALIDNNSYNEALTIYDEYEHFHSDNDILHNLAIKAVAKVKNLNKAKEIHSKIEIDGNVQLCNALIKCYGSCGDIESAQNVFYEMNENEKDIFTLNSMMDAFVNNSRCKKALQIYNERACADWITHMFALKACGEVKAFDLGQSIIQNNIKTELLSNNALKATVISFYGNCFKLDLAQNAFNEYVKENKEEIVLIHAMMSALITNDSSKCALDLYDQCVIKMNDISHTLALKACVETANFDKAMAIHQNLKKNERSKWKQNASIMVNLIAIYSKSGHLDICCELFDECLSNENALNMTDIFNAMIDAFCCNGQIEKGMDILNKMDGAQRSIATYIILLKNCSRLGMVKKGKYIWKNVIDEDEIRFNGHIVNTMVDCFARSGYLHTACDCVAEYEMYQRKRHLAENRQKDNEHMMWTSLLSACTKYNNLMIGQYVYNEFGKRFDLETIESAHVLFSNINQLNVDS